MVIALLHKADLFASIDNQFSAGLSAILDGAKAGAKRHEKEPTFCRLSSRGV